ncbi:hypothetical protein QE152_g901 [Popillia japonica]|uniref:Uncharacterized protein n=1 Tax=Popillia japonica TaxID=7064 RepID=A0AAW1NB36_POPJA
MVAVSRRYAPERVISSGSCSKRRPINSNLMVAVSRRYAPESCSNGSGLFYEKQCFAARYLASITFIPFTDLESPITTETHIDAPANPSEVKVRNLKK